MQPIDLRWSHRLRSADQNPPTASAWRTSMYRLRHRLLLLLLRRQVSNSHWLDWRHHSSSAECPSYGCGIWGQNAEDEDDRRSVHRSDQAGGCCWCWLMRLLRLCSSRHRGRWSPSMRGLAEAAPPTLSLLSSPSYGCVSSRKWGGSEGRRERKLRRWFDRRGKPTKTANYDITTTVVEYKTLNATEVDQLIEWTRKSFR